jgi:hypothetical protein
MWPLVHLAVPLLLASRVAFAAGAVEQPAELERLWGDLAAKDPARVDRALSALVARPAQAVPFLKERVRPVRAPDGRLVARWLAELDHERFAVRQRATRELRRLAETVEPALRRALNDQPAPEGRRRIERLLDRLREDRLCPPAERLRAVRAVEVLERIDSPEGRRVLAALARGAAGAQLTVEAKAALQRLEPSPAGR